MLPGSGATSRPRHRRRFAGVCCRNSTKPPRARARVGTAGHAPLHRARLRLGGAGALGSIAIQVGAFALALLALVAILWAIGYEPGDVFRALWDGSVGSTVSLGISLTEAVPLILTATAFWVSLR